MKGSLQSTIKFRQAKLSYNPVQWTTVISISIFEEAEHLRKLSFSFSFPNLSTKVNDNTPVNVLEDVALGVLDSKLEGQGRVVTLQDCSVIVEHSQLTARVAQEGVGSSRVIHIMDCCSNQSSYLVQLIEASLG